jgi:hypothetical protein
MNGFNFKVDLLFYQTSSNFGSHLSPHHGGVVVYICIPTGSDRCFIKIHDLRFTSCFNCKVLPCICFIERINPHYSLTTTVERKCRARGTVGAKYM